jgi:signal transduction histidine kinase
MSAFVFMNIIFTFSDYLLFFVGTLNLVLSVFILINEPKNKVNTSFAIFAFFLTVWTILLLLFKNIPLEFSAFVMRAIYVSGLCIAVGLWYFVHQFPKRSKINVWHHAITLIITSVVIILMFIPGFIVKGTFLLSDGSRSILLNPIGFYVFAIPFGFFYLGGLALLWKRLRGLENILKKSSFLLLVGLAIAVFFGAFFNIILPSPFFLNYRYIHLGPPFTFAIVVSVAYGIAKYQLMNIKALITEVFVILLILIQLLQVIFSTSTVSILINSGVLLAVLTVGFLLIRSTLNEYKRREQVTKLAHSLEKANLRLKEIDRQKTDFLSIASHQLRTPLSIAKGYIELIQDGAYGDITKKTNGILNDMNDSNEHLVKLVDEFLDITRIEQGRTKFSFANININNLSDGVVKELTPRAKDEGLKLVWKSQKNLKEIEMDEEKVRHVIFNFIDNAIKYSNKGSIMVSSEKEGKGIAIRVRDKGFGFGKEDEANFFQKFYRGKNVEGTNVTGTGLGLYVCRKFIESHGGHVWAKSPGLGKGSEFGFWIPYGKKTDKMANKNIK